MKPTSQVNLFGAGGQQLSLPLHADPQVGMLPLMPAPRQPGGETPALPGFTPPATTPTPPAYRPPPGWPNRGPDGRSRTIQPTLEEE